MNRNGRPMSQRQFDVLFTVAAHGPVSPSEVSRYLLLWPSQSQGALASLVKRKLVDRQYTGLAHGERVGYVLTAAGRWIVNLAQSEPSDSGSQRCTCGVAWGEAEGPCVCEPSDSGDDR